LGSICAFSSPFLGFMYIQLFDFNLASCCNLPASPLIHRKVLMHGHFFSVWELWFYLLKMLYFNNT
jgi:hypothetical protein